jgi:glycosyltransferase involved in cell wall biosynthesis
MAKKKIAIVVQRYGLEVNGGAELHARMIAEKLADRYDVTVLTSRALDYVTWKEHYAEGTTEVNGVKVIRFHNSERVQGDAPRYLDRKFRGRHIPQKIHRWLGRPNWWLKLVPSAVVTDNDGEKWLTLQGPGMPDLKTYINSNAGTYHAFIFFSAIYYPSAIGILSVPNKSIVVPTMHDEPPAYYPIYKKVMAAARWILFNSAAEQRFCQHVFPIENVKQRIVAVGIDINDVQPDNSIPVKFGITTPYVIYIGRIDEAKGCGTIIEYFTRYKNEHPANLKLVLVGKSAMDIQPNESIIQTGFVSDEEKNQLLKQAQALIIPSVYESLSLVLLESFALHIPVIATEGSEVLTDHIDSSNGGWHYKDYDEFATIIQSVIHNKEENKRKGEAGFTYVTKNYTWENVLHSFDEAIADVMNHTA